MTDDTTQANTWKDTLIEVLAYIGALLPFLPIGGLLIWLGTRPDGDELPAALRADPYGDRLREARGQLREQGDRLERLGEDCRRELDAAGNGNLLERAQCLRDWRDQYKQEAEAATRLEREIGERNLDGWKEANDAFHALLDRGELALVPPELRERWDRNDALKKSLIDDQMRVSRALREWDSEVRAAVGRLLQDAPSSRAQDALLDRQQREIIAEGNDVKTLAELGVDPALQQDARDVQAQQHQLDAIRARPAAQQPAEMRGLQRDIAATDQDLGQQADADGSALGAQSRDAIARQRRQIDAVDAMVAADDAVASRDQGELRERDGGHAVE